MRPITADDAITRQRRQPSRVRAAGGDRLLAKALWERTTKAGVASTSAAAAAASAASLRFWPFPGFDAADFSSGWLMAADRVLTGPAGYPNSQ